MLPSWISIHAPREGGDVVAANQNSQPKDFNPRPPRGGRPNGAVTVSTAAIISIHAPREGGDGDDPAGRLRDIVFQSTPPARGATQANGEQYWMDKFQSTPPARGATLQSLLSIAKEVFQSTPPARGATLSFTTFLPVIMYFNPRPPRGGRRCHYGFSCLR